MPPVLELRSSLGPRLLLRGGARHEPWPAWRSSMASRVVPGIAGLVRRGAHDRLRRRQPATPRRPPPRWYPVSLPDSGPAGRIRCPLPPSSNGQQLPQASGEAGHLHEHRPRPGADQEARAVQLQRPAGGNPKVLDRQKYHEAVKLELEAQGVCVQIEKRRWPSRPATTSTSSGTSGPPAATSCARSSRPASPPGGRPAPGVIVRGVHPFSRTFSRSSRRHETHSRRPGRLARRRCRPLGCCSVACGGGAAFPNAPTAAAPTSRRPGAPAAALPPPTSPG